MEGHYGSTFFQCSHIAQVRSGLLHCTGSLAEEYRTSLPWTWQIHQYMSMDLGVTALEVSIALVKAIHEMVEGAKVNKDKCKVEHFSTSLTKMKMKPNPQCTQILHPS